MKREIKFRAKDKANGEWRIGHYTEGSPDYHYITTPQGDVWQIDENTLSEWTGLKDKGGVYIYEGHICEVDNNENANHLQTVNCNYAKPLKKGDLLIIKKLLSGYTGQILSNQGDAPNLIGNVCNYSLWNGARQLMVVGSIYETPELLTTP